LKLPVSTIEIVDVITKVIEPPVYAKLKDSTVPIQSLVNKLDVSAFFDTLDLSGIFKSENIVTIGNLCSLGQSDINRLPLKAPKLESFERLIKLYEENAGSSMGSVEEEMAKLEKQESSSCLDTSIESEALNESLMKNEKKQNSKPDHSGQVTTMEVDSSFNVTAELEEKKKEEVPAEEDDTIKKFMSCLNDGSGNLQDFALSSIGLDQMFKLTEFIEDLEMKLIQFKRKLRMEMMVKHEKK
jgi:hypothetical protein